MVSSVELNCCVSIVGTETKRNRLRFINMFASIEDHNDDDDNKLLMMMGKRRNRSKKKVRYIKQNKTKKHQLTYSFRHRVYNHHII